jgi:Cu(I)/Ag(I) efflux system membrane fusion protein
MNAGSKIQICAIALALPLGMAATTFAADPPAAAPHAAQAPAASVSAEAQQHIDRLAKAYLATQKLLADDKLEGVADEMTTIQKQSKALAAEDRLKTKAQAVADTAATEPKTLDEARTSFKELSTAVAALLKAAPPTAAVAPALYDVYCPMAKADWLQTSKEVANPYMGKPMATCGKVKATIESRPEPNSK